jgi:hypothetical protein
MGRRGLPQENYEPKKTMVLGRRAVMAQVLHFHLPSALMC